MKQTANYNLNKPDETDVVDFEKLNENMDIVDGVLKQCLKNDTAVTIAQGGTGATTASQARTNLGLGAAAVKAIDTMPTAGSTNLITSGGVKTALDAKAPTTHNHMVSQISDFPTSLPANGGNAETINGFTVASNVPANAKFTDTIYVHPASHPASMITGLPTSLPANGGNSETVDGYHVAVVDSLPSSQVANTIYFVKK